MRRLTGDTIMIASRRASLLVVLAHPDDELFHGGMLSHLSERGVRVTASATGSHPYDLVGAQRALLDSGGESLAGNMLHGDERNSVGLADVVRDGDLGVISAAVARASRNSHSGSGMSFRLACNEQDRLVYREVGDEAYVRVSQARPDPRCRLQQISPSLRGRPFPARRTP